MKFPPGIRLISLVAAGLVFCPPARANWDVQLLEVPDYDWQYGCFGTATGNLMAYWDRHGFPDFYTGPTGGGLAPLSNQVSNNFGIVSLWASRAGIDGRPANLPGHVEDYYFAYESTLADRFVLSNRTEHAADCIGDFIGLNQKRWTNMNNECDGNVDGFAFTYWDTNGLRRVNYQPPPQGNGPAKDIPSGLRAWARWRGYDADVFSQLVEFNPRVPAGTGFTFADLKAEIDAGYPVLAFLQSYTNNWKARSGMSRGNPDIHAMLIYGYFIYNGTTNVYVREGYGTGEKFRRWAPISWLSSLSLPLRGVIGFHPKPKIRTLQRNGTEVTLTWDGPSSWLYDDINQTTTPAHWYQVERAPALQPADFQPVGPPTAERALTFADCCDDAAYYRVRLLP